MIGSEAETARLDDDDGDDDNRQPVNFLQVRL